MAKRLQNIKIAKAKSIARGKRLTGSVKGDDGKEWATYEPTDDITIECDINDFSYGLEQTPLTEGQAMPETPITGDTVTLETKTFDESDIARVHSLPGATYGAPHQLPLDTMDLKYRRILRDFASQLWAIEPQRLLDMRDVLLMRAQGGKASPEFIQEYCGLQAQAPREAKAGAVAVIGLRGIISHRIEQVQDISGPGGTSVEGFTRRFRAALNSSDVSAIVFDVDSPGGSVDGVPELAAEIREARGKKPIIAATNTLSASAAFWIAAAAEEITITPSGQTGSIGVFAAHEDISAALEQEGRQITLVHAGKFKVEGNPFEPLTDEARANIQTRVDEVFGMFVDAVAAGRNVSSKRVRSDMGEGRVVGAREALERGMVDRIETFDETIARVRSQTSARARTDLRRRALAFT
jgi:signal peptide peptidase SppA